MLTVLKVDNNELSYKALSVSKSRMLRKSHLRRYGEFSGPSVCYLTDPNPGENRPFSSWREEIVTLHDFGRWKNSFLVWQKMKLTVYSMKHRPAKVELISKHPPSGSGSFSEIRMRRTTADVSRCKVLPSLTRLM